MNIALLGPSGAGKGTQAAKLLEVHPFEFLSAGDLLRQSFERGTPHGLIAQRYAAQGELVPDDVVDAIIAERILAISAEVGILLDGFPRTKEQAEFLDELLRPLPRTLQAAIFMDLREEQALRRFEERLVCHHCFAVYHARFLPPRKAGRCDRCGQELHTRIEDTSPAAKTRWRVFQRNILPVLKHYQSSERLFVVDAGGTVKEVHDRLVTLLESIQAGTAMPSDANQLRICAPERKWIENRQRPKMPNLVLLGGPGSGKGTQAEFLKREFGLRHIASGELFRENLKQDTPLGKLARNYMNRGELVPDEITECMIEQRLGEIGTSGFLLDGFPRTLPQAEALTEMLNRLRLPVSGVFYIKAPDETLINRLSGRWICRDCQAPYHLAFHPPTSPGKCDLCAGQLYQREDDKPETARARLKTFHRQTEPLIDYYRGAGLLVEIDGEGAVSEISSRLKQAARRKCIDRIEQETKAPEYVRSG